MLIRLEVEETTLFPNAHRYRDYVINSFNNDKPFDQFIMEQIAGDLMPSSTDEEYNEKLTGTGFLALGPHNYELQDKELLRMEVVDEQLTAVGKAFMGLTMDCARCHDHPFDPISIQDYYSMAGNFSQYKQPCTRKCRRISRKRVTG